MDQPLPLPRPRKFRCRMLIAWPTLLASGWAAAEQTEEGLAPPPSAAASGPVVAQAAAPAATTTLPAVTVKGSRPSEPGDATAGGFSTRGARIGTLGDRPLLDTPFSINVISGEQLESAGVRDLKNIARLDPSLSPSFSAAGYYDSVSIRGLELNNWTSYHRNGLLFANQAKTPLENVERVEVLRGLSGFAQGFAAPGGAVNYVTERPTSTWQRRVELATDGFGSWLPGLDIGGPLTADGRLGVRINAAGGREKFFVAGAKSDRAFGSVALDWLPLDTVSVKLDAQLDRRDGPTQPSLRLDTDGHLPKDVNPTRFLGQSWATYKTRTREFGLDVEWRLADSWRIGLKANDAHLYRDDLGPAIEDIQPNGDFTLFEYKSTDESRSSRNAELALRGELLLWDARHDVVFGVSQRRLVARFGDSVYQPAGTSNIYQPVELPDPGSVAPASYTAVQNRDRGVFISDFIAFNERWQALLGLRYSKVDFESVFDVPYRKGISTPTVALIYKPVANMSIYGSYAEGLEQGSSAPIGAENANQQLRPITAKQREIGVKGEWMNGALTGSAAVFDTEVPLAYLDAASNVFDYLGTRRHRGLEVTVTGAAWRGSRVNAGFVLLDAKTVDADVAADEGKVPSGVAERQFSMWLDQRLPMAGLSAQLGWRGASRRAVTSDNAVFAPGWAALDIGLRYATEMSGQRLMLGLNLFNVGNKRYIESSGFGQLLYGSTRALALNARLEF